MTTLLLPPFRWRTPQYLPYRLTSSVGGVKFNGLLKLQCRKIHQSKQFTPLRDEDGVDRKVQFPWCTRRRTASAPYSSSSIINFSASEDIPTSKQRTNNEKEKSSRNVDDVSIGTDIDFMNEEWVPPNRPLRGDTGQSDQYQHIQDEQTHRELLQEQKRHAFLQQPTDDSSIDNSNDNTVDWMKTRRSVLETHGGAAGGVLAQPGSAESVAMRDSILAQHDDLVADLEHTLHSRKELITMIRSMGGKDIAVIVDDPAKPRMGGGITRGMMIVTLETHTQMRSTAELMLRQLRRRHLEEVGVVGAKLGIEGEVDDPTEHWLVVDCGSYIVHLQSATTRSAIDLEGLWSGRDGMHNIDIENDDEVEEYVAQNPVPESYWDVSSGAAGSGALDWDDGIARLENARGHVLPKQPFIKWKQKKRISRKRGGTTVTRRK